MNKHSESLQTFSDTVNISSNEVDFFNKSKATMDVIIFVIDAGYICVSGSNSKESHLNDNP